MASAIWSAFALVLVAVSFWRITSLTSARGL